MTLAQLLSLTDHMRNFDIHDVHLDAAKVRESQHREALKLGMDEEENDGNTATTATMQRSPFLKLPAELRNTIYELALLPNMPISVERDSKPKIPAILRTCHQTRREAGPIYFSSVRGLLYFYTTGDIYAGSFGTPAIIAWLHNIGTDQSALIKRLELHCTGPLVRLRCCGVPAKNFAKALFSTSIDPGTVRCKKEEMKTWLEAVQKELERLLEDVIKGEEGSMVRLLRKD